MKNLPISQAFENGTVVNFDFENIISMTLRNICQTMAIEEHDLSAELMYCWTLVALTKQCDEVLKRKKYQYKDDFELAKKIKKWRKNN